MMSACSSCAALSGSCGATGACTTHVPSRVARVALPSQSGRQRASPAPSTTTERPDAHTISSVGGGREGGVKALSQGLAPTVYRPHLPPTAVGSASATPRT
jgi:hypothetical protein